MSSREATTSIRALPVPYLSRRLSIFMIIGYGALCVALASAGFSDADDHFYLEAADSWLAHVPFLGTTHWHLRHPLVLAIAASFRLFGRSEAAMILPTIVCYFGILLLTFDLVQRVSDRTTGMLAAILVASTPLFAILAKGPNPDEMEVFLTLVSFWFFLRGIEQGRAALLVLSGVALGVAWTLRQSCVPLLMLYGILFVAGYKIKRSRYLLIALGFVPVAIGELLFYLAYTGDAFYRFAVDSRFLDIPSAHVIGRTMHGLRPPFNIAIMKAWVPDGFIDVHWLINPYIDFFANWNYGLIFFTGVWAAFVLCIRGSRASRSRQFLLLIGSWSVLSLIVVLYVLNLRPQPRYFAIIAWTMTVMTALWVREVAWPRSRWLASTIIFTIMISDILLINLRPDPLHEIREAASYAGGSTKPLWIYPAFAEHAAFLLEGAAVADRVHAGAPETVPPGGLYFTTRAKGDALIATGWREVWHEQAQLALLMTPFQPVQGWVPDKLLAVMRRGYPESVVLEAPGR